MKDNLSKELGRINKEIKGLEKELKGLDKSFGKNTKNMDVLAEKQKLLNQVVEKSREKINKQVAERDKLVQKYNEEKTALDEMVASNTASTKEINKQKQAVLDRANQINKLNDQIEKATIQEEKYVRQLKTNGEQMYRVANNIQTYDERMQSIQKTSSEMVTELEHQEQILSKQGKTWKAYDSTVAKTQTQLQASIETYRATTQEISRLTQEQQNNLKLKNETISKLTQEQQKLEEIRKTHSESSQEYINQTELISKLNREKWNYIQTEEQITQQLEQRSQVLQQSRRDIETYTVEMSKLGNTKIQQNINKTVGVLEQVAEKTAGASVVSSALTAGSTNIFMQYEQGLAKVSTLVDTKVVDMDKVGKDIVRISNETGQSVSGMMESAYQALSAGVKVGDLNEFLATSSKLATAGFTDSASAVKLMSQIMNNYGKEAGNAEQIASKLIATSVAF